MKDEIKTGYRNWRDSELRVGPRARLLMKNLSSRLRGHQCCGHHGQPGC
ncbi:MAG TPA: hypothetical protein VGB83_11040 [Actinomycetota bacterium]